MNNPDLIKLAISKGAVVMASISGGKDGQAMVNVLAAEEVPIAGLIHADLGSVEWPESMAQCQKQAARYSLPLHVVRRTDTNRDPIKMFLLKYNFIISAEGIRGEESTARAKKIPLEIRWEITSTYYKDMTVEEAIAAFNPAYRLALTWFPIFGYTLQEVWATEGMTMDMVFRARMQYKNNLVVPKWWPFHPAYAYGNERVNCMF